MSTTHSENSGTICAALDQDLHIIEDQLLDDTVTVLDSHIVISGVRRLRKDHSHITDLLDRHRSLLITALGYHMVKALMKALDRDEEMKPLNSNEIKEIVDRLIDHYPKHRLVPKLVQRPSVMHVVAAARLIMRDALDQAKVVRDIDSPKLSL